MWKKYWKIAAAAVFLTAAGFCYGGSRLRDGEIRLEELDRASEDSMELENPADSGGSDGMGTTELAVSGSPGVVETESLTDRGDPGRSGTGETAGNSTVGAVSETCEEGFFVHICGEVRNPGVYELKEGSRIFEAVDAAGGFTDDAAVELLNLAGKIYDGMKIVILSEEEAERLTEEERRGFSHVEGVGLSGGQTADGTVSGGNAGAGANRGETDGLVNLNTASKQELMTLNGIGESRAEAIIQYRQESGGFSKIEDIMKVPGIKDAAFQKIKDRIKV